MMQKSVLVCLLVAVAATAVFGQLLHDNNKQEQTDALTMTLFKNFMAEYQKEYPTEEERLYRLSVFKSNLEVAKEQARLNPAASFGVTKFSDLTIQEFEQFYLMPNLAAIPREEVLLEEEELEDVAALPTSFDWKDKGAVTAVKNQGQCGSCWAFSATEEIESMWFLAGNPLPLLSEQQVVDCDPTSYGCSGGWPYSAYEYVIQAGGIEGESDYPYTAQDGQCSFQKSKVISKLVKWYSSTNNRNETQMQVVLQQKGPLSVCVAASTWATYRSGVLTSCDNGINHCVQATGFQNMVGNDGNTYPVWNIRNSWGTGWGMDGYIYLERNKDMCALADESTYPQVA
ncbi:Cysteine proteinase [Balamuthia mandrillaris]